MIEKRSMYLVESSHFVEPITALYDTEMKKVVTFQYLKRENEYWYVVSEFAHCFNTAEEAHKYVEEHQAYLRSKFPEVLNFIREMEEVDQKNFDFDKSEYLGEYSDETDGYYEREYKFLHKVFDLLKGVIRNQTLCLNAESINIDKVDRVIWNDLMRATIILYDGHEVTTCNAEECTAVQIVWGRNYSRKTIEKY